MDKPKFFYQSCESKYPGYVALMAQFLPTFDSKNGVTDGGEEVKSSAETAGGTTDAGEQKADSKIVYQKDGEEIPETDVAETVNEGEAPICFYFLLDRSGSMSGSRVELAKDAMKLFLQSLPPNCKF